MEYTLAGLRHNIAVDLLDDEEYEPAIIDRAINRTQEEIFNKNELSFQEKIFSAITVSIAGVKEGSNPSTVGDSNGPSSDNISIYGLTTTGFNILITRPSGLAIPATTRVLYIYTGGIK